MIGRRIDSAAGHTAMPAWEVRMPTTLSRSRSAAHCFLPVKRRLATRLALCQGLYQPENVRRSRFFQDNMRRSHTTGGCMKRFGRFAAALLLLSAIAEARVISYSPYTDRAAT